jgi:hypothetical protein
MLYRNHRSNLARYQALLPTSMKLISIMLPYPTFPQHAGRNPSAILRIKVFVGKTG